MKEMEIVRSGFRREEFCEDGSGVVMVCPEPRRAGLVAVSNPGRMDEGGLEVLDIMVNKAKSKAPYLCGSPPSRAENPLVHDVKFKD